MLVIKTRKKAVEIAETGKTAKAVKTIEAVETAGADKNGKKSKGGENPRSNFARVPYIWYFITF